MELTGFVVSAVLNPGNDDFCAGVSGVIPEILAKLAFLTHLSLKGNREVILNKASLGVISRLVNLRYLSLNFAGVVGAGTVTLPNDFLEKSVNLAYLDLSGCGIGGRVPQSFGKLPLKYFHIGANNFSGAFPSNPEIINTNHYF